MQLSKLKSQAKYLSENEIKFFWDESKEETAHEMFLDGENIMKIKKYTKLSDEKLVEMLADLPEEIQSIYNGTSDSL